MGTPAKEDRKTNMDIEIVLAQKKQIASYRDTVLGVKRKMVCHQQELNRNWQGQEMIGMNSAMEEINRRLLRISNRLEEIENEIMSACKSNFEG